MDQAQRRELALDLVQAALRGVDPRLLVPRFVQLEGQELLAGERVYDLAQVDRLVVVGAGKAGAGMAAAVEAILGQHVSAGWVNVRHGLEPERPLQRIHIHPAGHPLPDADGLLGTRRVLGLLERLGPQDLAVLLLSGGASALLVQPVPGVTLRHLQRLTDALLRSGAAIGEVNCVRKHLSQVKGGQLARRLARGGARALVLVLSDVVGNPLDAIGSGPCAPDPTTFADAWQTLGRYGLLETIPQPAREHLQRGLRGQVPETPKPGDGIFEQVYHILVGDVGTAALAAQQRAQALGLNTLLLTTYLEGEARAAGHFLAALAKEEAGLGRPLPRPACLVLGGETTVSVRGTGKGGRNQEVALAAALELDGWDDAMVVTAATDGTDGPTDAAGAIADGQTVARARALGLDPADHLARNDSYPLFEALGDLIVTGPTGTNVSDLAFVLAF